MQCVFINRLFHNNYKASSCIISMRLFSSHFETFIKKSASVGRGTTIIATGERQGQPLFCKAAGCLQTNRHQSHRDLPVHKLLWIGHGATASWRISWRCYMETIFLGVFRLSESFRKEVSLTFTVCKTLARVLALFTCEQFLRGLFMCLE